MDIVRFRIFSCSNFVRYKSLIDLVGGIPASCTKSGIDDDESTENRAGYSSQSASQKVKCHFRPLEFTVFPFSAPLPTVTKLRP